MKSQKVYGKWSDRIGSLLRMLIIGLIIVVIGIGIMFLLILLLDTFIISSSYCDSFINGSYRSNMTLAYPISC